MKIVSTPAKSTKPATEITVPASMCQFQKGRYEVCEMPGSSSRVSSLQPTTLTDLPVEILSLITRDLGFHDLMHLAASNHYLRGLYSGFPMKSALRRLEDNSEVYPNFFFRRSAVLPCHICSHIYSANLHFAPCQRTSEYGLRGRMAYDRHCMKCVTIGRSAFLEPGKGELFQYDKQMWIDCKVCRMTTKYDATVLAVRLAWRNGGMCWKCHEEMQETEWLVSSPAMSPSQRRGKYGDTVRSYKEVRNKDFVRGVVLSRLSYMSEAEKKTAEEAKGKEMEKGQEVGVPKKKETRKPPVPKQKRAKIGGKTINPPDDRQPVLSTKAKTRPPLHKILRNDEQKVSETVDWLARRRQLEFMAGWSGSGS